MRPVCCSSLLICTTTLCFSPIAAADEPQVWTGLIYSFTSTAESPAIDHITPNVHFARNPRFGLFNAATELGYVKFVSPESTLWATKYNNDPGATISASNWAELNFLDWESAFGSFGSLASSITESDAVVHLELDNVYLDLRFTEWGNGQLGGSGNFSYLRAVPVPEPAAWVLAIVGCGMGCRRRRR